MKHPLPVWRLPATGSRRQGLLGSPLTALASKIKACKQPSKKRPQEPTTEEQQVLTPSEVAGKLLLVGVIFVAELVRHCTMSFVIVCW